MNPSQVVPPTGCRVRSNTREVTKRAQEAENERSDR